MKKILSITLISTLAIMLSTGCTSKGTAMYAPDNKSHDTKVSDDALYVNTHNNKKIAHAIKKAGNNTGWEITKFKNNEVIAEKTSNGNTISSTIKFSDGHIEFSNNDATSNLRDAIEKELSGNNSSH